MNDRLHKSIYGQTLDEMKEDKGAWEYEQEPSLEAFKQVMWERDIAIEQLHDLGYELGQKIEPSGDLISRQAVLMELDKYLCGVPFDEKGIDEVIKDLPSVKQEQKTGHWYSDCRNDYFICNQCKAEFERFSQGGYELIDDYNYCPNCGARMVEQESEE